MRKSSKILVFLSFVFIFVVGVIGGFMVLEYHMILKHPPLINMLIVICCCLVGIIISIILMIIVSAQVRDETNKVANATSRKYRVYYKYMLSTLRFQKVDYTIPGFFIKKDQEDIEDLEKRGYALAYYVRIDVGERTMTLVVSTPMQDEYLKVPIKTDSQFAMFEYCFDPYFEQEIPTNDIGAE